MANIYEQLGVRTIINACGTATRLSGGIMPEVAARAMLEASGHCVDMAELQSRASEIIAEITGAQAGLVTAGAAAGLLLGTAACITGADPARMNRLPDTRGMRHKVVMVRGQRNSYDHAVRASGASIHEVGLADRLNGTGVRDAEAWEIAEAIDEHTACVFHVAHPQARPALREVLSVAHAAGVPVLVDAAAQLPPVDNLQRFIEDGADLVAFSGGKAILGPQGSGILCGRRDLVAAAALQSLDLDLHPRQWHPPPLFDGLELRGLPRHGIGRSAKVGKEQIIGLLVALRHFVAEDTQERHARWRYRVDHLAALLERLAGLEIQVHDPGISGTPCLLAWVVSEVSGIDALELALRLQNGRPAIHLDLSRVDESLLIFNPTCLQEGEPAVIGQRLAEFLPYR